MRGKRKSSFQRGPRKQAEWDQTEKGLESAIWKVNFIPRAVKGQKRGLLCFLISEKSLWLCHERKGWVCWLLGWETRER